jgi:hypothetical protein
VSAVGLRTSIKMSPSDGTSGAVSRVDLEPIGIKGQIWKYRSSREHKSKVSDEA